jgi:cytidyltransferase-like protein
LFSLAGASNTVLEASVPYSAQALKSFLGATAVQGCNEPTARAMAMAAYQRAHSYNIEGPVFGLGCTAAIATNRERKGEDRCHFAIQSATSTTSFRLELDKSLDRQAQETLCADAIIAAMAETLGIACDATPALSPRSKTAPLRWQALLEGHEKKTSDREYAAILPGAFNPLHKGHLAMLESAKKIIGDDVALEISIRNVDKPPLDYLTMEERAAGIGDEELVFTNAPTFVEKSELFPGATFLVGIDTVIRIADPKYYASEAARDAAIQAMTDRGNRFLVFGRLIKDRFTQLEEVSLLPALKVLCSSADDFRVDVSSTEIRSKEIRNPA